MTEKELEAEVRRLMRQFGLWGYHTYDSRRSAQGWPDWVILGTGILFRELKIAGASPTPAQRAVGARITWAGGDWSVWRPADLASGRIVREMAAISPMQPRANAA